MLAERHSHKTFWLAIVILSIVAVTFLVATAWVLNELNNTQNSLLLVRSELVSTQAQLTNVEAELGTTRAELVTEEIELSTTKGLVESLRAELGTAEIELSTVEAELGTTRAELGTAEIELNTAKGLVDSLRAELGTAEIELNTVEAELFTTRAELETAEIELNRTEEFVESLEATLSNLQVNYDRLTTGYGYVLRDPSYQEMKDFLARDETSRQEYVPGEYTCVDFAKDVKANAAEEGIRCVYVIIEYRGGGGHAIVAFDTTDRDLVYVEPQFDWEVEPEIGKRYHQCVIPPTHYRMESPDYDDTITRIIVIW